MIIFQDQYNIILELSNQRYLILVSNGTVIQSSTSLERKSITGRTWKKIVKNLRFSFDCHKLALLSLS